MSDWQQIESLPEGAQLKAGQIALAKSREPPMLTPSPSSSTLRPVLIPPRGSRHRVHFTAGGAAWRAVEIWAAVAFQKRPSSDEPTA